MHVAAILVAARAGHAAWRRRAQGVRRRWRAYRCWFARCAPCWRRRAIDRRGRRRRRRSRPTRARDAARAPRPCRCRRVVAGGAERQDSVAQRARGAVGDARRSSPSTMRRGRSSTPAVDRRACIAAARASTAPRSSRCPATDTVKQVARRRVDRGDAAARAHLAGADAAGLSRRPDPRARTPRRRPSASATDDAALVERLGVPRARSCPATRRTARSRRREDLRWAEWCWRSAGKRLVEAAGAEAVQIDASRSESPSARSSRTTSPRARAGSASARQLVGGRPRCARLARESARGTRESRAAQHPLGRRRPCAGRSSVIVVP